MAFTWHSYSSHLLQLHLQISLWALPMSMDALGPLYLWDDVWKLRKAIVWWLRNSRKSPNYNINNCFFAEYEVDLKQGIMPQFQIQEQALTRAWIRLVLESHWSPYLPSNPELPLKYFENHRKQNPTNSGKNLMPFLLYLTPFKGLSLSLPSINPEIFIASISSPNEFLQWAIFRAISISANYLIFYNHKITPYNL